MTTWPANGTEVDVWDAALLTWLTTAVFDTDGTWKANFAIDVSFTIADACNIGLDTTTGTKIGTATGQKLGFFNATPVDQAGNTEDLKDVLIALGLIAAGGATPLDLDGGALGCGTITLIDAANIVLGTTTGTKIGTATSQKLGFFNAAPVVQPVNTTDLRAALIDLGLLATGGATPLDLNGGSLTGFEVKATNNFDHNGTDGVTDAGGAGTVVDVLSTGGGIVLTKADITYATDGTYNFDATSGKVSAITIANGRITAVTVVP